MAMVEIPSFVCLVGQRCRDCLTFSVSALVVVAVMIWVVVRQVRRLGHPRPKIF